jgi:dihydrolipoamide dehydrogenase
MKSVLLETRVVELKPDAKGIRVTFDGKNVTDATREQTFDRVLVAVGRRPNSAIPGLDRTQVQLDPRGFIVVDDQRRTAEPSIFAIGDVVGEPMLAHKASHETVAVIRGRERGVRAARSAVVFTDRNWHGRASPSAGRETTGRSPWRSFRGARRGADHAGSHGWPHQARHRSGSERILGVGIVGLAREN